MNIQSPNAKSTTPTTSKEGTLATFEWNESIFHNQGSNGSFGIEGSSFD